MPAYAYLRRSSVTTESPGDASREAQEDAVRALAALHGDGDLVILSDWGVSGRKGAEKRPGYAQLLAAIEAGRCKAVYSYSLSRLSRSLAELSKFVKLLEDHGIPLRLRADSIDTSTASGVMLAHILGSVAQFESDVTRERTKAAYAARAARGEKLSNTPFYGDKPGEDLEAVVAAFQEAGSYSGAARLLNQRGVPCRTSKRGWWPSAVNVIIDRVQPQKRHRARGYRAGGTEFLLARLLRCPTCDTMLTGIRDRAGNRVRYACRLGSVTPHERVSVSEHLILEAVKDEVAHLDIGDAVEVAKADEQRRAELEAQRERIVDMVQAGMLTRQAAEPRYRAIQAEIDGLDARTEIVELPTIDWDNDDIKDINAVLHTLFAGIGLDRVTFQPLPEGFDWRVKRWRRP